MSHHHGVPIDYILKLHLVKHILSAPTFCIHINQAVPLEDIKLTGCVLQEFFSDAFCSYEMHRTGMLQIMFLVSLESSGQGGEFSTAAENLRGIGMCLWCCWKDLDEQDFMEFIW